MNRETEVRDALHAYATEILTRQIVDRHTTDALIARLAALAALGALVLRAR